MKGLWQKGFSLVELSIVLVVIGVLAAITLSLGTGQVNIANIKSAQAKLDKIDQALGLYLKINGSLPCPASGANNISVATFGRGVKGLNLQDGTYASSTCPNATVTNVNAAFLSRVYNGVVPTRDLGLSDDYMFDSWGNRITYVVASYCTDPDNWDSNNTFKCSSSYNAVAQATKDGGNIIVQDLSPVPNVRASATIGTTYFPGAAYILVSHGRNGIGAYPRPGSANTNRVKGGASTSNMEKRNGNYAADGVTNAYNYIYADGFINDGSVSARYFDDIVHWKTAARTWDDANSNSLLPNCKFGQILVSNGSGNYKCQYDFQGVEIPAGSFVTTTSGTSVFHTYDISTAAYEGVKYITFSGGCYSPYGNSYAVSYSLQDVSHTDIVGGFVCQSSMNVNADNVAYPTDTRSSSSALVRVPQDPAVGVKYLKITFSRYNTGGSAILKGPTFLK